MLPVGLFKRLHPKHAPAGGQPDGRIGVVDVVTRCMAPLGGLQSQHARRVAEHLQRPVGAEQPACPARSARPSCRAARPGRAPVARTRAAAGRTRGPGSAPRRAGARSRPRERVTAEAAQHVGRRDGGRRPPVDVDQEALQLRWREGGEHRRQVWLADGPRRRIARFAASRHRAMLAADARGVSAAEPASRTERRTGGGTNAHRARPPDVKRGAPARSPRREGRALV